jgi:hypothetical protein
VRGGRRLLDRALGFRLTDQFAWGPNGAPFMRDPRHHSIAFIDLPLPGGHGLNHFMIEANTPGGRRPRARSGPGHDIPIINSLGQHYNDPMLSFYVVSPGGFNVEFGWKGSWSTTTPGRCARTRVGVSSGATPASSWRHRRRQGRLMALDRVLDEHTHRRARPRRSTRWKPSVRTASGA